MRKTLIALIAALGLFTACAPVAQVIVDAIDSSDGATLAYVERGIEFDPGPAVALGVIVRAEGGNLALLEVPDGARCTLEAERLDCRLGDRSEPVTIRITGQGVVANATWRRAGSSTVYLTFARTELED